MALKRMRAWCWFEDALLMQVEYIWVIQCEQCETRLWLRHEMRVATKLGNLLENAGTAVSWRFLPGRPDGRLV
jgi:hypothetical protein